MQDCTEGQIVESVATFTDEDTGANVDPTSVAFTYLVVSAAGPKVTAAPVTLTYSGATVPAPGIVARTAPGVYEAQVDSTGLAGYWYLEWPVTGTGQATIKDTGRVYPKALS